MTSKQTVLAILVVSAMFAVFPHVIFATEPFVVDNFESGLAKWSGSGGGGAANGIIEETTDARDGKKAMKVTLLASDKGWAMAQGARRGNEYSKLGDKGYEAMNFWFKGLKGTDKTQLLLHLTGIGEHSTDNRWDYKFTAPLNEWTFFSIPFEDMKPWNQEKRPFALENLDYFGFFRAAIPWPDFEFILDQIEFGPITEEPTTSVAPWEKLPAAWGRIKKH